MSQEYIGAIAIVLVSALKLFGIEVAGDIVTGFITGALGLWVAIARYNKKDINILGVKN